MISSPLGSLDLKSMTNKSSKPSSKEEAASFENEMIESEKRMKKKTKIDGREAAPQAQNQRADNSPKPKTEQSHSKTQKSSSIATKSATQAPGIKAQSPMSQGTSDTAATPTEASEALQVVSDMVNELQAATQMATAETTSLTPAMALQNSQGISLEGFEAVQPQMMIESTEGDGETVQKMMGQIEAMVQGVAGTSENTTSDMSSENSEQNASGLDLMSDFSAVQNPDSKATAASNQVFATVLENKTQNLDSVKQNNVENLVTQASAILKDGGGEMKLQLRPEGLGTVDLRVGLQNGQVSIEIMTQDQNVKKMFEDSIFDIRGALETQNLKIDTFHVGVSENFDQSLAQQNASQFAEREFARDFMGQFREDRQSLRNQGLDSMLTNKTSLNKPEGLSPATSGKNINGRLNIIA